MQYEVEFEAVLKCGLTVFVLAAGVLIAADTSWSDVGYSPEPAHVEQIHIDAFHGGQRVSPEVLAPDWTELEHKSVELIFEKSEGMAA